MGNVAQFRPSSNLALKEIVGTRGGIITDWLRRRPDSRARFRIRVGNLRMVPRPQWKATEFKYLGGGIAEIKWTTGDVQFRALGFDQGGYFVMVIGCTHKESDYDPRDCIKTARKRKREVENGERKTISFEP